MLSIRKLAVAIALTCCAVTPRAARAQQPLRSPVIGRWDLTVQGAEGPFPSWLEIRLSGNRTLVGQFVARFGSTRPVSRIEVAGSTIRFTIPPQWEAEDSDITIEGTLDDDRLSGWMTGAGGSRLTWTAVRAPVLHRSAAPRWGAPIRLFNGVDLTGWEAMGRGPNQWRVIKGVLTSAAAGANLVSKAAFTDFKLHAEFRVPPAGNSGIYLRGRHEVQIEDSKGLEPSSLRMGGVYGFLTPNEDAASSPGEWQSYDITLVGRLVTVVLNGKTVIARQEIPGITGGALNSDEGSPGPLLLQGDHTTVEYRRIVLTPAR